jgi:hypothetical protein
LILNRSFCRSEKGSGVLRVFDSRGSNQPLKIIEKLHYKPVHLMKVGYEIIKILIKLKSLTHFLSF